MNPTMKAAIYLCGMYVSEPQSQQEAGSELGKFGERLRLRTNVITVQPASVTVTVTVTVFCFFNGSGFRLQASGFRDGLILHTCEREGLNQSVSQSGCQTPLHLSHDGNVARLRIDILIG
jgi:hypothetical protein